jgi:hypothetical protein
MFKKGDKLQWKNQIGVVIDEEKYDEISNFNKVRIQFPTFQMRVPASGCTLIEAAPELEVAETRPVEDEELAELDRVLAEHPQTNDSGHFYTGRGETWE